MVNGAGDPWRDWNSRTFVELPGYDVALSWSCEEVGGQVGEEIFAGEVVFIVGLRARVYGSFAGSSHAVPWSDGDG